MLSIGLKVYVSHLRRVSEDEFKYLPRIVARSTVTAAVAASTKV